MDYAALKAELLAGHPVTGAYDADDTVAAGQLNALNRTRVRGSMSGDDLFQQTDSTEFAALTDAKKQLWLAFCGRDSVNPSGANVVFVQWVFGGGSATVTALNAARQEAISRATELGLPVIREGHVQQARAM